MAEFKDAALWMKLAFLMTMLGVVSLLFGFAIGISEENNKIKGAMIAGKLIDCNRSNGCGCFTHVCIYVSAHRSIRHICPVA